MSKEAMKLALEALEKVAYLIGIDGLQKEWLFVDETIKLLEKELTMQKDFDLNEDLEAWKKDGSPIPTKQEQGEPVAVRQSNGEIYVLGSALVPIGTYLYTTPQQRKPLTDEQIKKVWGIHDDDDDPTNIVYERDITRAIEAAHGIKE
jgi:hypothetical protein